MRLFLSRLLSVTCLNVLLAAAIARGNDSAFKSIFNGKDLSGWDGLPTFWSVRDGAITGQTTAENMLQDFNTFLVWQGGELKDFELRLKFRLTPNNEHGAANSGIQYRSKVLDPAKFIIGGYQADIDMGRFLGMLYEEKGRGILMQPGQKIRVNPLTAPDKPATDPRLPAAEIETLATVTAADEIVAAYKKADWNDMVVIAHGNQLQHFVNGKLTADVTDADDRNAAKSGVLALQLHVGPPMTIQFKDIQLKSLPSYPKEVGSEVGQNKATPVSRIKVANGFKVELLYSVQGKTQGSWINLCVDPKGRIIASDQYGGLYRFSPPVADRPIDPAKIEKMPVDIRAVNGMAFAFGALYVGVNKSEADREIQSGLYRITDSDGDDQLDKAELLRAMDGDGEHGVHAVVPTPDGKALYLVCGNGVKPTHFVDSSPVPALWGEDHLLPRIPDGHGFMRDAMAPGGIIYKISPDGKTFEVFSSGYRNIFDACFNREGELFTYDADMELDFNTSWYRPTRICHVTSGSEYGWRNGAGKRPVFYADNLPPVINIGPGSPTGMTFGYGARFPARYQNALFILDWSWGKMYAVHLRPDGATYSATHEEFLSGTPLPLADAVIHPDGSMYFVIGGRRVQSGIYRVTYAGTELTEPVSPKWQPSPAHELRHKLEALHGKRDPDAINAAWPHLASTDRFMRWAARTALEHQPIGTWGERAMREKDPAARLEAVLGLARAAGVCPTHRTATSPAVNPKLGGRIVGALEAVDYNQLDAARKLTLLRTIQIALHRFGPLDPAVNARVFAKLDPLFPARSREENWLLCETLVYLQSPSVAARALKLIADAPTQEEQIEYARSLRMLKAGWTLPLRNAYFEWFLKAANYRGGASFAKYIELIRKDALATLTDAERTSLAALLDKKPERKSAIDNLGYVFAGRPFTNWTLEELGPIVEAGMKGRDFEKGRKMFGAAACFACHRFGNDGGMTGPDLTSTGGRYSPRELLDQILHPSKEINEQYVPTVVTKNDGSSVTGTIVNLVGDFVLMNEDPSDPNQFVAIDRTEVKSIERAKVSAMPPMLLSRMNREEILDLLAYVLSGGNRELPIFQKARRGTD